MAKAKKGLGAWSRPKLMVMSRPHPEEYALTACKYAFGPTGPGHKNAACAHTFNSTEGYCYNACSTGGSS